MRVAQISLPPFTPLPKDGAHVRVALQRLPQLLVAVLKVDDIVRALVRSRRQVRRVRVRVHKLAHHVEAVQLMEDVERHNEVARVVVERRRRIRELGRHGRVDLGHGGF